jgi:hypothetical protein
LIGHLCYSRFYPTEHHLNLSNAEDYSLLLTPVTLPALSAEEPLPRLLEDIRRIPEFLRSSTAPRRTF